MTPELSYLEAAPVNPLWVYRRLPRDYWHVAEPLGSNFTANEVRGYYIDMRAKAGAYDGPRIEGFPARTKGKEGESISPVTVTQLALGHYEYWLENNQQRHLDEFLRCADWLVQNHGAVEGWKNGWPYRFEHKRLGIRSPFISAMGQGQGISVLVRAHAVEPKDEYLEIARAALEPFRHPVEAGGVLFESHEGLFFEEYPSQPGSRVLNGHLFATWGLFDFAVSQRDAETRNLFEAGATAARNALDSYDVGYWSRYDLFPLNRPNIASPFYHELHIAQLRAMAVLTGYDKFSTRADRWEKQFRSWIGFTRAVTSKVAAKVGGKLRR